ncbi:MAG: hypothetical protein CEE38_04460 [Planctomycetes bacterium B3_Pla]|nr:MAG: hypothetical protein CEE38_04460 [Planctomycetes bacterium B3_Pla]
MITHSLRQASLMDGEDAEHLLDVRERPFDNSCKEIVPLDSRQLGTFQDICGYWNRWRQWKTNRPPLIAYDRLRTEFLRTANCGEEHLSQYTVDQVADCITHTLYESSIPMFLLEGRNKTNVWRQRYDLLVQPNILDYWHRQESVFLTRKHQYDNTKSPDEKDDPWIFFAEYKFWVFRPERDLPAAYLVLGASLDAFAMMWIFCPQKICSVYPDFFTKRVMRADGQEYKPKITLTPRSESEFFESLWIQTKLDLQSNGLLDTDTSKEQRAEIKPIKLEGRWNITGGSLEKLRRIDSNPTQDGIRGTKKEKNRLKDYLTRRRKRPDIAKTLYWENGRIKTKMACGWMFSQE